MLEKKSVLMTKTTKLQSWPKTWQLWHLHIITNMINWTLQRHRWKKNLRRLSENLLSSKTKKSNTKEVNTHKKCLKMLQDTRSCKGKRMKKLESSIKLKQTFTMSTHHAQMRRWKTTQISLRFRRTKSHSLSKRLRLCRKTMKKRWIKSIKMQPRK